MFSDLQEAVSQELCRTLKEKPRFDTVMPVTDFLEPILLIRPRMFVKFRLIEDKSNWAVYIRKNICEVYQTTEGGWTMGRPYGKKN